MNTIEYRVRLGCGLVRLGLQLSRRPKSGTQVSSKSVVPRGATHRQVVIEHGHTCAIG